MFIRREGRGQSKFVNGFIRIILVRLSLSCCSLAPRDEGLDPARQSFHRERLDHHLHS